MKTQFYFSMGGPESQAGVLFVFQKEMTARNGNFRVKLSIMSGRILGED
jgi:hypothetical protein